MKMNKLKDRYEKLLKKKIQLQQELIDIYKEKKYLLNQEIEKEEGNNE